MKLLIKQTLTLLEKQIVETENNFSTLWDFLIIGFNKLLLYDFKERSFNPLLSKCDLNFASIQPIESDPLNKPPKKVELREKRSSS